MEPTRAVNISRLRTFHLGQDVVAQDVAVHEGACHNGTLLPILVAALHAAHGVNAGRSDTAPCVRARSLLVNWALVHMMPPPGMHVVDAPQVSPSELRMLCHCSGGVPSLASVFRLAEIGRAHV